jgi:hypothetical protein
LKQTDFYGSLWLFRIQSSSFVNATMYPPQKKIQSSLFEV